MEMGVKELLVLINEVITEQETEHAKAFRIKSNRFKAAGQKAYPSNAASYRTPKQQHIDIFGKGSWDLMSFGAGILEEDELIDAENAQLRGFEQIFRELGYESQEEIEEEKGPESKKKRPACLPGAQYHDKKGRFTDPYKSAGSWSIAADDKYKRKEKNTNCDRGQMRRAAANRTKTMVKKGECGRKSRRNKTYIRCYDNKRVMPEVSVPTSSDGTVDLYKVAKALQSKKERIEQLETAVGKLMKRKDCKSLTINDATKMIRALVLSTKGKFADKPEK